MSNSFIEIERPGSLAAKTESEKKDSLDLLGQITSHKRPDLMTKADARAVKDVLLRLAKNRSKPAQTRGLSLDELLDVKGVEVISARTANAYIGSMQTFFRWAVDNGYADENVLLACGLGSADLHTATMAKEA